MKKYTFYLGLSDQKTKLQNYSTLEASKIVMNLVGAYFGGWTISEGKWFYQHDDGQVVIENSLIINTLSDKDYKDFVTTLKTTFNQESILIEVDSPIISFE